MFLVSFLLEAQVTHKFINWLQRREVKEKSKINQGRKHKWAGGGKCCMISLSLVGAWELVPLNNKGGPTWHLFLFRRTARIGWLHPHPSVCKGIPDRKAVAAPCPSD